MNSKNKIVLEKKQKLLNSRKSYLKSMGSHNNQMKMKVMKVKVITKKGKSQFNRRIAAFPPCSQKRI